MKEKDLEKAKTAILEDFAKFLLLNFGDIDLSGASKFRSSIVGNFRLLIDLLPKSVVISDAVCTIHGRKGCGHEFKV